MRKDLIKLDENRIEQKRWGKKSIEKTRKDVNCYLLCPHYVISIARTSCTYTASHHPSCRIRMMFFIRFLCYWYRYWVRGRLTSTHLLWRLASTHFDKHALAVTVSFWYFSTLQSTLYFQEMLRVGCDCGKMIKNKNIFLIFFFFSFCDSKVRILFILFYFTLSSISVILTQQKW